jgi:hypothetical protein
MYDSVFYALHSRRNEFFPTGKKEPFQITMAELKTRLEVCEERNNYFREHGPRYRKKHLVKRVKVARQEGRDKAATRS